MKEKASWDPNFRYNIDNVRIYYENNITELIDPSDKKVEAKSTYKEVRLGETLYEVMTQPTYIMP